MNKLAPLLDSSFFGELTQLLEACTDLSVSCDKYSRDVERCRDYFRVASGISPHDFYDSVSRSFSRRYLPVNLMKSYYLIHELDELGQLDNCQRVVDLGCGPGTFSLALGAWAHQKCAKQRVFNLKMVDASRESLDLFENIWTHLDQRVRSHIICEVTHCAIKNDVGSLCQGADLVILSNSLVELLRGSECSRQSIMKDLADSGAIIGIIDYQYEEWRHILDEFSQAMREDYDVCVSRSSPDSHSVFEPVDLPLEPDRGSADSRRLLPGQDRIRFIKSILVPKRAKKLSLSRSLAERLVQRYKSAWESHDFDLLHAIFSADALYREKPQESPFQGLEEIVHYWKVNAGQQAEVSFTPKEIAVESNTITVHWKCTFFRKDKRKWCRLDGVFEARVRGGRVYEFEEHFEKRYFEKTRHIQSIVCRTNEMAKPASGGEVAGEAIIECRDHSGS